MREKRYTGTRLLPLVEHRGTTATWLSRKIGSDPSYMHHVMRGRRTIPETKAQAVADLLGVPLVVIFDLAPEDKPLAEDSDPVHTAAS